MSAVPKKKLCWNCEGNVALETDNCPYCAVYLHPPHAAEEEENRVWNPSYRPSKTEEIPSPLYQIQPESEQEALEEPEKVASVADSAADEDHASPLSWSGLYTQLKCDIFPILFLMMGSVFFLFGVVLLLFSQNGTFTLQWQERDGIYFLLAAIPLVGFGWRFLQQLGNDDLP